MSEADAKNADLSALRIDREKQRHAPGQGRKWWHLLWLLVPIIAYFIYQSVLHRVTPATSVKTTTVRLVTGSEAAAELVATGYVVAQVKAAVSSKATGRLRVLNVEEGDSVRSGDVIAELDNDDIRADFDLARANLKRARADSVQAALDFQRQHKLFASGHTTSEVMEAATAAYDRAQADVEAMAATVDGAMVALENTVIRAPFSGTVLTKTADVGEMVAPFASATSTKGSVVTIADMKSLEVEADVSESNINKVMVGQPCEIVLDAYPDHKYAGRVKKIIPTADRTRATVMTKIAFDSLDNRVLPEMSARVNFLSRGAATASTEMPPVLAVAKAALTMRDGRLVVFRVTAGRAQQVAVQTGRQLGEVTEILSGLTMGDSVVLSPAGGLKAGDKIDITN